VPPPRPPSPPTRPSIALSEASAQARAQQQQQQSHPESQPLQQNRRRLLFGWPRRATAASNEIKADAAKVARARVLAAEQPSAAEAARDDASHNQDVTLHRTPPRPAVLPNEFPSRGPNGEALAVLSARQYLAVVTSEGKVRLMWDGALACKPKRTSASCAPSSLK
jgi:hypothetical protein